MSGDPVPWSGGRVAVVHDWFQGYHGSERVVETLVSDVFADAQEVDVLTFHAAKELLPDPLAARITRESRLAGLPGIRQRGHDPGRWRWLLPYMSRYFRSLDLSGYDFVLASSHAAAAHVIPPPEVPYACYCHSPMRYLWIRRSERDRLRGVSALAFRLLSPGLRRRDKRAAQRPHRYVANSEAVQERIARFYGRPADVVHPPVHLSDLAPSGAKVPGRFLWVNRLVAYKRPDLVLEAFRGTPYELTMVGIGPLERELRDRLPANVKLLGWVSRERLAELYATASGFVHLGEEDFGMAIVEALAAGNPVVGIDAGGARDIVEQGVDGILVPPDPTVEDVRDAIRRAAVQEWDADLLRSRAQRFAPPNFVARMRELLATTTPSADED